MSKDIVGRRVKVASNLRNIADASRREDGTDIPLGQTCREAADLIESLSPPDGVGLTLETTAEERASILHRMNPNDRTMYYIRATNDIDRLLATIAERDRRIWNAVDDLRAWPDDDDGKYEATRIAAILSGQQDTGGAG